MTVNQYSICPGGTEKKLKFCCPDLVHELDALQTMLNGEQLQGCLSKLESLSAKTPGRACLLTLKASLQLELEQWDAARQTVQEFVQVHPKNPVAMALWTQVVARTKGVVPAVQRLQQALKLCSMALPTQVFQTIVILAEQLLAEGRIFAAMGHARLAQSINQESKQATMLNWQILQSPDVPLILKDFYRVSPLPSDAATAPLCQAVEEAISKAQWADAVVSLEKLIQVQPGEPIFWKNLSYLRGWMADDAGMVQGLREFARLSVPLDDAIEAEALAQLHDDQPDKDNVDLVDVTIALEDIDRVLALAHSSRRVLRIPADRFGQEEGVPPPRLGCGLLDRDMPETAEGLTYESCPKAVGTVWIFGRETDRQARFELTVFRPELDGALAALQAVFQETLGQQLHEDVQQSIPPLRFVMQSKVGMPPDTPLEIVRKISHQEIEDAFLNRWANYPQTLLAGKSPLAASQDPNLTIPLRAVVLSLEVMHEQQDLAPIFVRLRELLGLPALSAEDISVTKTQDLPMLRWHRIRMNELPDDVLQQILEYSGEVHANRAACRAALEVIARPAFASSPSRSKAYMVLSMQTVDLDRKLEYLNAGRECDREAKQPEHGWDLREIVVRYQRVEVNEIKRIIYYMQRRYAREPAVLEAMLNLLHSLGLVLARPSGAVPPTMAKTPEEAATTSGLWTPEAPAQEKKESALWLPGMD